MMEQEISSMGPHQAALTRAREELEMLTHDVDRLFGHVEPHLRPAIEQGAVESNHDAVAGRKATSSATSSVNNLADDIAKVRDRIRHLIAHIEV